MRRILRSVLSALGINKHIEAASGRDGLAALRNTSPDLILCDWEMEPMSGYDLVKEIRTNPQNVHRYVPIIMVTSHSSAHHICMARDAGVTEYLVKPISAASLYKRIAEVIARPRAFVSSPTYSGPDRRRGASKTYNGPERRQTGDMEEASSAGAGGLATIEAVAAEPLQAAAAQ